jgi:fructose-1,6-bisphosphatase/sedoheptulose 1,7-bisphosphatase-like protein
MFAATGVTNGTMLDGVRYFSGGAKTDSLIMRSKTKTIRRISATHHFEYAPSYKKAAAKELEI